MAGIWRPSSGDQDASYAIITLEAGADIFFYQDRHGAVLRRRDRMAWLEMTVPEAELLQPLPKHSFRVEEVGPEGIADRQHLLAL